MALTKDAPAEGGSTGTKPGGTRGGIGAIWSKPWVLLALAGVLLTFLAWGFIDDPTITAPTRDPAWYTWRANVIFDDEPVRIVEEWGPFSAFSGGYRVTVPMFGALMRGVGGVEAFQFSGILMIGIPVLAGLAMGAFGYRTKRDPALILLTLLAAAGLFLTTPYVGYLDNIFVLFVLASILAFVPSAQTSWGARAACFLLGILAAFTHPTTCVLFGLSLLAVFGWRVLTARFRFGDALRRHGPALMSVGFGMVVGLAMWVVGIWGKPASLVEAALPPPYEGTFFNDRQFDWILSMKPIVTFTLAAIAVVATIVIARRRREPADTYSLTSIWYLLPYAALLATPINAQAVGEENGLPLYRFFNATTAIMILAGLGAWLAIRWLSGRPGSQKVLGVIASVVIVAALGWVFLSGWQTWIKPDNQWISQQTRVALSSAHEIADQVDDLPLAIIGNYATEPQSYGWGKTFTNVFRTTLPGEDVDRVGTYWGTLDNFLAGEPTNFENDRVPTVTKNERTMSEGYLAHLNAVIDEQGGAPPIVFVVREFSLGENKALFPEDGSCLDEGTVPREEIIPLGCDIGIVSVDGVTTTPSADVIDAARQAEVTQQQAFDEHEGPLGNPGHLLQVLMALLLVFVLPGLLAARFFELEGFFAKFTLVPAISVMLTLLTAIVLAAVWRGPFDAAHGWTAVLLAAAIGGALSVWRVGVMKPFQALGRFFNGMFGLFSEREFAALMGVQFLIQAADGVLRGTIGKSIGFGGEEGFDVTTVPSPRYLLAVVLALYLPYTLISPFIGVFIDRFERRRVLTVAAAATAVLTIVIAVPVLFSLGDESSEGKVGVTIALIVAVLIIQACVRIMLAVKSAALPGVLSGKDLLQGNGLSQAGGAFFQIVGIAFGLGASAFLPSWTLMFVGAGILVISVFVARQITRMEVTKHVATFREEARRVISDMIAGLKEVAGRTPAAIGLVSFQMLRYQFWGFTLFVFALYASELAKGEDASLISLALTGAGGLLGGVLGMILAQKYKDKIPPIRMLLAAMFVLGGGALVFGGFLQLWSFALMLFCGFLGFFVGKIAADTIVQQAMPDDFRGRAFALFDIAYNLGFVIPALILFFLYDEARVRALLVVSGVIFLVFTALVARWAGRHRDEFQVQDDLRDVEHGALTVETATD
ncbi:MAG: MFS transporter [Actinomycetota bacterium]